MCLHFLQAPRLWDLKIPLSEDHEIEYGIIKGVDMSLEIFGQVDPRYLVETENLIKAFMNDNNYNIKSPEISYKELVAIPKKTMKKVKTLYSTVTNKYSGMLNDVRNENSNLKKELDYTKTIIDSKEDNICNLKDNVSNLKDNLKSKDELIKMLQEKLSKK